MIKTIGIVIIIAVLAVLGKFFLDSRSPLLSPFAGFTDDRSSLVHQKITPPLSLDFSTAPTLPVLDTVPRYIVYNSDTHQVYYAKNVTEYFSPASFTKLLSSQVALDMISPDASITATAKSVDKIPTVLGIKVGEVFTAAELLRGAIATSGNDAAQTLTDGAALANNLSPTDFVHLMNRKAEFLGMTRSHFANPDGLDDPKQYSTLEDLAIMVNNVQKNYPEIIAVAASDRDDIATSSAHGRYYLPNWNGLLGIYPGVTGLKIAYTEGAGYSTIITFSEDSLNLVAIVTGTQSYLERDMAAASLLDAALIAEKRSPKNITKNKINLRYKTWGDLARQIKKEIKETESNDVP